MPRTVPVCVALVAMLPGCVSAPERFGNKVAEWPAPEVVPLPLGTYALCQLDSPEESPPSVEASGQRVEPPGLRGYFGLPAPGPVGFETGEDGQLFARVGDEKIPLPPGRYCWRACPDTQEEPTRCRKVVYVLQRAGEIAGGIVLCVAVIAVVVGVLFLYAMAAGHTT